MPTFDSSNSSGGVSAPTDSKNGYFRSIYGRWVVPNVIFPDINSAASLATWIGLGEGEVGDDGGINAEYMFQVGVLFQSVPAGGLAVSNYNFYFYSPFQFAYQVLTNISVSPGDAVFAMICTTPQSPDITCTVWNETTGEFSRWTYSEKESGVALAANWAGWMVGNVNDDNNVSLLGKYGAVIFDSVSAYHTDKGNVFPDRALSLSGPDENGNIAELSSGSLINDTIVVCSYIP